MSEVVLQRLGKRHPGAAAPAVDAVDLTLPSGTLTTLVGPSGCGKSTLLALVAGLVAPDAGDVLIGGRSVLRLAPEKRGAVLMEQDALLFPHLTVAGNVGFGLRMRGVPKAEAAGRVAAMLDKVRLADLADRRPASLSGGQAQRVALARALVTEPAVLLLDEPFAALDPDLREEMRLLVRGLQTQTRTTMLLVTHDRAEAVATGDRLAVMLAGRIVQSDLSAVVYERPATLAAARFLGFSNRLQGRVRGWWFETDAGRLAIEQAALDGPAVATFRPEAAGLSGDIAEGLAGRVAATAYRGGVSEVVVETDAGRVTVHADPVAASALVEGQAVTVTARADRVRVFSVSP